MRNVFGLALFLLLSDTAFAVSTPSRVHVASTSVDPLTISIAWNRESDHVSYQVQRSVNGGNWANVFPAPHTTQKNSYVDTNIKMGRTYRYRVRAYGTGDFSPYSRLAVITTRPADGEWTSLNDMQERNGWYHYKVCSPGPLFGGADCVTENGWNDGGLNSQRQKMEWKVRECNPGFSIISGACGKPAEVGTVSLGRDNFNVCALNKSGGVICWGSSGLGPVSANNSGKLEAAARIAGLESGVTGISVGHTHACAIQNNAIKCWGDNKYGQLGVTLDVGSSQAPLAITSITGTIQRVVAGRYHTCAIVNNALKCWGLNDFGQLGNGNTNNSALPVDVAGMNAGVTDVALGIFHTCAIQNGVPKCWGKNNYTQLGLHPLQVPSRNIATTVPGLSGGFTSITSGIQISTSPNGPREITGEYVCATGAGVGVRCWGKNASLGINSPMIPAPLTTRGSEGIIYPDTKDVTVVSGDSQRLCMIASSPLGGILKCWGYGAGLGDGNTNYATFTLATVKAVATNVTDLSVSGANTCFRADKNIYCWGSDSYGEAGNGPNYGRSIVPHPVLGQ